MDNSSRSSSSSNNNNCSSSNSGPHTTNTVQHTISTARSPNTSPYMRQRQSPLGFIYAQHSSHISPACVPSLRTTGSAAISVPTQIQTGTATTTTTTTSTTETPIAAGAATTATTATSATTPTSSSAVAVSSTASQGVQLSSSSVSPGGAPFLSAYCQRPRGSANPPSYLYSNSVSNVLHRVHRATESYTTTNYIGMFLSALTETIDANRAIALRDEDDNNSDNNNSNNATTPRMPSPTSVSPFRCTPTTTPSTSPAPFHLSRSPDPTYSQDMAQSPDSSFMQAQAQPAPTTVTAAVAPKPLHPQQHQQQVAIPFNSKRIPSFTLDKYLQRIAHYLTPSPACLLVTMVYMDRILARKEEETGIYLSDYNVHKLLMACIVLASKFWSDNFYNDSYYAKVGGVSMADMVRLETTALVWLDFRLLVSSENLFAEYAKMVQNTRHALIVPGLMRRIQIDPAAAAAAMEAHLRDSGTVSSFIHSPSQSPSPSPPPSPSPASFSPPLPDAREETTTASETETVPQKPKALDKSHHLSTCQFTEPCPCGCGRIITPPFQVLLRGLNLGDSAADDRGPVAEKR